MNELIPICPISPLRQRMMDDMTMRRFSPETQRNYIRHVGRFATWPDPQERRETGNPIAAARGQAVGPGEGAQGAHPGQRRVGLALAQQQRAEQTSG